MSVVVNLFLEGTPENIQAFIENMERDHIQDAITSFPGNLKHDYFMSLNRQNVLLLMNAWEDQASLQSFLQSDLMKSLSDMHRKFHLQVNRQAYDEKDASITPDMLHFIRR